MMAMAAESVTETPPQIAEPPVEQTAPAGPAPPAPVPAPAQAEPPARKAGQDARSRGKPTEAPKDAKDTKDAKDSGAGEPDDGPSVAAHPRAARGVARAKGWGGLIGFLLGGYLSLPTNTLAGAALHALVAGLVCYLAVWAGAVFVWRRLVMLELKNRELQLLQAHTDGAGREPAAALGERAGAGAHS
jgi:hypothetical protein